MSPDVHTEAVQAALAKHKERKMAVPMPSKRRSLVVQTSMDAYTPPGLERSPRPTRLSLKFLMAVSLLLSVHVYAHMCEVHVVRETARPSDHARERVAFRHT